MCKTSAVAVLWSTHSHSICSFVCSLKTYNQSNFWNPSGPHATKGLKKTITWHVIWCHYMVFFDCCQKGHVGIWDFKSLDFTPQLCCMYSLVLVLYYLLSCGAEYKGVRWWDQEENRAYPFWQQSKSLTVTVSNMPLSWLASVENPTWTEVCLILSLSSFLTVVRRDRYRTRGLGCEEMRRHWGKKLGPSLAEHSLIGWLGQFRLILTALELITILTSQLITECRTPEQCSE